MRRIDKTGTRSANTYVEIDRYARREVPRNDNRRVTPNRNNQNSNNDRAREGEVRATTQSIQALCVGENLLSENEDDDPNLNRFVSPVINVTVANKNVLGLIDSGSQCSAVSEKFVKSLRDVLPIITVDVGGETQRVSQQVLLSIGMGKRYFDVSCIVVPKLNKDLILGCDWLVKEGTQLDFDKKLL